MRARVGCTAAVGAIRNGAPTHLALPSLIRPPHARYAFGGKREARPPPQVHDLGAQSALWPYMAPSHLMGFREASEATHLYNRTNTGQVVLSSARGKGFGGGALTLKMLNATADPLAVSLPMGSTFLSRTPFEQSLITQQDVTLELEPHEERDLSVDAYCGVSSFACPGSLKDGGMELTPLVAPAGVRVGQAAVWAWTSAFEPPTISSSEGDEDGGAPEIVPASEEYEMLQSEFPDEPSLHGGGGGGGDGDGDGDGVDAPAATGAATSRSSSGAAGGDDTSASGGGGGWFDSDSDGSGDGGDGGD